QFWDRFGGGGQALLLSAVGVGTILAALMLESLHTSIIRFWEGYPADGWLGRVLLLPTRPFFWAGRKLAEWEWARRRTKVKQLGEQFPDVQKYEEKLVAELNKRPDYNPAAVPGNTPAQKADEIRAFVDRFHERWWWYWWWHEWEKLLQETDDARTHRK